MSRFQQTKDIQHKEELGHLVVHSTLIIHAFEDKLLQWYVFTVKKDTEKLETDLI